LCTNLNLDRTTGRAISVEATITAGGLIVIVAKHPVNSRNRAAAAEVVGQDNKGNSATITISTTTTTFTTTTATTFTTTTFTTTTFTTTTFTTTTFTTTTTTTMGFEGKANHQETGHHHFHHHQNLQATTNHQAIILNPNRNTKKNKTKDLKKIIKQKDLKVNRNRSLQRKTRVRVAEKDTVQDHPAIVALATTNVWCGSSTEIKVKVAVKVAVKAVMVVVATVGLINFETTVAAEIAETTIIFVAIVDLTMAEVVTFVVVTVGEDLTTMAGEGTNRVDLTTMVDTIITMDATLVATMAGATMGVVILVAGTAVVGLVVMMEVDLTMGVILIMVGATTMDVVVGTVIIVTTIATTTINDKDDKDKARLPGYTSTFYR
jgi:hypothetical protein